MNEASLPEQSGRRLSPYIPIGAEIGAYRIEAFVDRGGMASIYEATDLRLNRKVALKVLGHDVSTSTGFRERFVRESRFAASLDHPNIVPIYEAGEHDGLLYIAMRYVVGTNLAGLLQSNGSLDPRHALRILVPVADALDTAHRAGLVHRDVKPANILLTASLGHEHVYLTDFGLTKRTSALTKLTATGNFIGTMAYISPEQIRGEPLDARTDLYALGCVAFECLTGHPPFVRDDQAALMWAHLSEPAPVVSAHKPELSPVDPVIAKALAKQPLDRYESCDEFVQTLSDAVPTGRHSAGKLNAISTPTGEWTPPWVSSPGADSAVLTAESALGDDEPAVGDGVPGPPVVHPSFAEPPPPGEAGQSSSQPPLGAGRPQGAETEKSPEERENGHMSTAGPPAPSMVGALPMSRPRHRRTRRRAVLTVTAAVVAVAAIVAVAVVVRPMTQTVGGTGQPTGVPIATAVSDSTGGSGPTSSDKTPSAAATSQEVVPPAAKPTPTTSFTLGPPVARVVPAPSLAIPTFDGSPVQVGKTAGFVAISPDGRLAYIARRAAGVVTVLDVTANKVLANVPIPAGPPQFIAFTGDGSRAYVSIYDAELTINAVAVLDTRTTRLVETIPVHKKPYALAVTPDQKFVYVPSHDAAVIDIIDVAQNKVVNSVPVAKNPHWVTFDADGKFVYIANHDSNLISIMNTATKKVTATIPVGTSPHSLEVSPDGRQVAVACFDSDDVYFIDTASHRVMDVVPVGRNPQDLTYAPDGRYLYTANVDADAVSVIDTESRGVTANVPTDSPTSVAVLPDGRKAYVTNLDTGTLTVLNAGG